MPSPSPPTDPHRLRLALETIVYWDTHHAGQVDGDEVYLAYLLMGAVARLALGLDPDGSEDPVARDPEGVYEPPALPAEWSRYLRDLTDQQLG